MDLRPQEVQRGSMVKQKYQLMAKACVERMRRQRDRVICKSEYVETSRHASSECA